MANIFVFDSKDITNSAVRQQANNAVPFATSTQTGLLGSKKVTTLGSTSTGGMAGAIHWKDEVLEVGGVKRKMKDVMKKPGWFGSTREWTWSKRSYSVSYEKHKWLATDMSSKSVAASFTGYESNWIKKDEPAMLETSSKMSEEELVFVILVMVYMESNRQQQQKNTTSAGVIAATSS